MIVNQGQEQEQVRRIPLAGAFNFRDLGGYRTADGRVVRWRRLFRSDGLHELTPDDIARLAEIGLATVIDLRTADELDHTGRSPLHESQPVVHCHLPFIAVFADDEIDLELDQIYLRNLEAAGACIREAFSMLAEPARYPVVFHCAAGKDRTGMLAALVLRALGVSDDQIVADYALTDFYLAEWLEERRARDEQHAFSEVTPEFLRARPETMARTLAALDDRHGSIAAFLDNCGVSHEHIERLRDQLLDGR